MKSCKRVLVLIAMILAVGCDTPATGPENRSDALQASSPREVVVRLGQEVTVGGTALRIAFTRVIEDSRCPVDVVCVWAGNAAVQIGLTLGRGPTYPFILNTNLEPRSVDFGGFRVTLLDLTPYPGTPEKEITAIRLRVELI